MRTPRAKPISNADQGERCTFETEGPSDTKQSFKEETDINVIIRRHTAGQIVTHLNPKEPQYGDFSNVDDYLTATNKMRDAEVAFGELPDHIIERFHGDPAELVAFMADRDNLEEARELGLISSDKPVSKSVPKETPAAKSPEEKTPTEGSEVSSPPKV